MEINNWTDIDRSQIYTATYDAMCLHFLNIRYFIGSWRQTHGKLYRPLHEITIYNFKSVVTPACGVGGREKVGADSGRCTYKTALKHQSKKHLK